jgi:hypothetical protein
MPFKSTAQQGFLEEHPEKIGGPEKLKEWEDSTDFSKLPSHISKDHPLHKLRANPKAHATATH